MKIHTLVMAVLGCPFVSLALNYHLELSGLGGIESDRSYSDSSSGSDLFLAPGISAGLGLGKMTLGRPEIFADYNSDLFLQTSHNHNFELGAKLVQPGLKADFFQEVSLGYSRETGSEDLDNIGDNVFLSAKAGFKNKWRHPLKFRLTYRHLRDDAYSTTRKDHKYTAQASVGLKFWKRFRPSIALTLGYNSSDEYYTYNFFSINAYGVYLINEKYYLLGAVQLGNRAYPELASDGRGAAKNRNKDKSKNPPPMNRDNGNGNEDPSEIAEARGSSSDSPSTRMGFLQLTLYREITGHLEWSVGGHVIGNYYTDSFGFADNGYVFYRLETGLGYQF